MRAQHDLGGASEGAIDTHDHPISFFDQRIDAMTTLLAHPSRAYLGDDSVRRAIEDLPPDDYRTFSYYQKWLASIEALMIERQAIGREELDQRCRDIEADLPALSAKLAAAPKAVRPNPGSSHLHDHDHDHDDHAPIEDQDRAPDRFDILEQAFRELLIEKNILTAVDIQREIEELESRVPAQGARMVAKIWTDPKFHTFALEDAWEAAQSLGIDMSACPPLRALENTPTLHHVVVCTLCSCYPRPLLGRPPAWYKSRAYRARIVAEPRDVLKEFGTELPETTEISVADSTADLRYIVVPLRPRGSQDLSEAELAGLVTRDSMIGVTPARELGG